MASHAERLTGKQVSKPVELIFDNASEFKAVHTVVPHLSDNNFIETLDSAVRLSFRFQADDYKPDEKWIALIEQFKAWTKKNDISFKDFSEIEKINSGTTDNREIAVVVDDLTSLRKLAVLGARFEGADILRDQEKRLLSQQAGASLPPVSLAKD